MTLSIRQLRNWGMVFMLVTGNGCAPRGEFKHQALPLISVKEMIYVNGWKCSASVGVARDGTYILEINDPRSTGDTVKRYRGTLSTQLTADLEVLARSLVAPAKSEVPTYFFYPDDSHHQVPDQIRALFEVVSTHSQMTGTHGRKGWTATGQKESTNYEDK